jgi:NAD(P)-dependent dehydrogenase (short-subunit alcohol dehydrogenase family)
MGEFQDRVAMVVGATGALGVVVARRLATAGAALVLPVRNPDKLAMASPDLAESERVLVVAADPAEETKMNAAVAAALARFGRLDVLVNAAGAYRGGEVAATSLQLWQELWEANLLSTLVPVRAALPAMLARKSGVIVNVASKAALAGGAGAAAYSASKAAVVRLTESLAAELRRHGIRVNCVLPGTIDTGANRAAMPDADRSGWVAPTSLAETILFLASDAARDVHGAALPVFGLGG